jgi:hypothetical protein
MGIGKMPREVIHLSDKKAQARTITEIRLHHDTRPSDFRGPLPGTQEAKAQGCTCPVQPEWPTIAIATDCPLHFLSAPPLQPS